MKLYNTPHKLIETITPSSGSLSVYTCGPTVYDYPHIGNWFTFLRYDTLVRSLTLDGYSVTWVMNITDVGHLVSDADEGQDKLEKGAKREGKTAWDVASFYSHYFVEGMKRLNMLQPDFLPKATEHIAEQIALIEKLEANNHTYVIDDGVYFDTSTFKDYAKFAQLNLEGEHAGARVEFNPQKRNASDFALWKFSPSDEQRDMEWDSPWGKGFPGWHLECSAMAMKYLGETIDIHAGGIDHIPVHHTNEIAQSEAATGKPFARYWLHANHISVNGEKISKSLGNSITLEDIEARGFNLRAFRLYALESHYRTQSKFSWEGLEAAQNRLRTLQAMADLRYQTHQEALQLGQSYYIELGNKLQAALADDLNTPQVLALLSEAADHIETVSKAINPNDLTYFDKFLETVDRMLGLGLSSSGDITAAHKSMLADRAEARKNQDWQQADEHRQLLAQQGIAVKDTTLGQIWFRQ